MLILVSYGFFVVCNGYYYTKEKYSKVIEKDPNIIIPDESFEDNQSDFIKRYAKKGEQRWNSNF